MVCLITILLNLYSINLPLSIVIVSHWFETICGHCLPVHVSYHRAVAILVWVPSPRKASSETYWSTTRLKINSYLPRCLYSSLDCSLYFFPQVKLSQGADNKTRRPSDHEPAHGPDTKPVNNKRDNKYCSQSESYKYVPWVQTRQTWMTWKQGRRLWLVPHEHLFLDSLMTILSYSRGKV